MSGLDFVVIVLQISNSFDMNAFFHFFFCLFLPGYKFHHQSLHLTAAGFTGLFGVGQKCILFGMKSSNGFPVETHIFEKSFIFCTFVCNDGDFSLRLHVVVLPTFLAMS